METLKDVQLKQAQKVDPSHIMQIGLGFWASKTLLTAVKLELFTLLASRPLTEEPIRSLKLLLTTNFGLSLYILS